MPRLRQFSAFCRPLLTPVHLAIELAHELAEYLIRRYPTTFHVVERYDRESLSKANGDKLDEYCDWGWDGQLPIKAIHVAPLDATHTLPLHVNDGERAPERALKVAASL